MDFEKSIVKKGTKLDETIIVFEEKSRNYTGVDFTHAGDKKKILITGFDPFQLDPKYYNYKQKSIEPSTFNPAGIVALMLTKL